MYDYNTDEVVSIGGWIGIFILCAIPLVNIIVILYLAFGSSNENLKNYGRALLILLLIGIILSILLAACNIM